MAVSQPLILGIAGGIGAMVSRLVTGPWPADAGDWLGVVALGVLVAVGVVVVLRIIGRKGRS